jgi:hypothetical protein
VRVHAEIRWRIPTAHPSPADRHAARDYVLSRGLKHALVRFVLDPNAPRAESALSTNTAAPSAKADEDAPIHWVCRGPKPTDVDRREAAAHARSIGAKFAIIHFYAAGTKVKT